MNEWLLIIGMMALTFIPRYLPIAMAGKFKIPPLLGRALEFVPIAVLTAIISQTSLVHEGELDLAFTNSYLYALVAAVITAWVTKHTFKTIVIGLVVYAIAFVLN
ncbi:AzlD domain-containing protein [Cocleimonas sp. KMM 6892]|uniref:AzlD domain-containing protein n=1 Tax=unclassified Cocleimonas TaxID=2639732 RepID=UPI002DBD0A30|nr:MULTISPECIES: AzlD domain-containing protein [unclassified Cocleimonas]MEB8433934.1 AzlD domain-containing protein [Cocleimonas sp. KMM 6892]MEC4716745.1 AzlD domain-containing protein [Cocleimonas sp. KMM 6895]MEC4746100.1 AzlD domain-containing protein [Cocleimonas sp. KMM 6896]